MKTTETTKTNSEAVVVSQASTSSTLTAEEKAKLQSLESVIRKGQRAFFQVSCAILQIERERLYREYGSISRYCREVWDMTDSDVSRCRKAAQVLENLEAEFDKLPANEAQARKIQHLKPEDQVKAWRAVLDSGKKITGNNIEKVVEDLFGAEEPEVTAQTLPLNKAPAQPKVEVSASVDLSPILFGLKVIQSAIPVELPDEKRESLLEQLQAAAELLENIKRQIG